MKDSLNEIEAITTRYARRSMVMGQHYSMLSPAACHAIQERQRAILSQFRRHGWARLDDKLLVEVGCGSGANLLELLRLGFRPQHLVGIELLADRLATAREVLPPTVQLIAGDAVSADIQPASQDLVFQAVVFSSLLDDHFQQRLADAMWGWLKPGGAVLWYDFTYDNPGNPDVRGVPLARVRGLFPKGRLSAQRVTLAPPIARRAAAVHPSACSVLNALPFLRTHLLCWIEKP